MLNLISTRRAVEIMLPSGASRTDVAVSVVAIPISESADSTAVERASERLALPSVEMAVVSMVETVQP